VTFDHIKQYRNKTNTNVDPQRHPVYYISLALAFDSNKAEQSPTSSYYPEGDGTTEWANQMLLRKLRLLTNTLNYSAKQNIKKGRDTILIN
jgi:hypothetical protein